MTEQVNNNGTMSCGNCGNKVLVKTNKKGRLYYNCCLGDGGCGCQMQSRTSGADSHMLKRIKPDAEEKEQVATSPIVQDLPPQPEQQKAWYDL